MRTPLYDGSLFAFASIAGCDSTAQTSDSEQPVSVIKLTQTGCQFLESESKDFQFEMTQADDCKKVNEETHKSGFNPLTLKPGLYMFEATNRDVPYELGFYLRGDGLNPVTLLKVSGGGLNQGQTNFYEITLKLWEYLISCPLNPTPDYPVMVR